MSKLISLYKNGNYFVELYEDGTKIRQTIDPNATEFIPEHPESIDLTITKYCDGGCPWCYMECSTEGKHAELMNDDFINGIHSGMEIAINGNDLSHPQLERFLYRLKTIGAFANITVNIKHFMQLNVREKLLQWQRNNLFWGLGISWDSFIGNNDNYFKFFLSNIDNFQNVVIHTIAGLLTEDDIYRLAGHGLKVLILGYKTVGNGTTYGEKHLDDIQKNQEILSSNLKWMFKKFEVVSFDNLALEQLGVKDTLGEEAFNRFYMGDEGSFTFYVDLVDKTFSMSSMCKKNNSFCVAHPDFLYTSPNHPDASIDQMFHYVREHRKKWK